MHHNKNVYRISLLNILHIRQRFRCSAIKECTFVIHTYASDVYDIEDNPFECYI